MSAAAAPAPAIPGLSLGTPPAVPVIEARGLTKRFAKRLGLAGRLARALGAGRAGEAATSAVDGVDLAVLPGEVVGLVGESGSGKSTLGRMVAGLLEPTAGTVLQDGRDRGAPLAAGPEATRARLAVQMVFQDPLASLNPRMRVADAVGEAPLVHGLVTRHGLDRYVAETLHRVGLDPALGQRYPHELSGGQRQRVGIARALAVRPRLLVCDEAVAALDVSVQAQVLNLFMDLREGLDLTYLFISHDLAVVRHVSDRVLVMYLGRVVESASTGDLFAAPSHPYAQALLAELPDLDRRWRAFAPLQGEISFPFDPPQGCPFRPRCPHAFDRCRVERPALREVAPGRLSACHLNDRT